ncbi:DUF2061 domain-containing protein [Lutibacter maritimus]|jgi:uncharacterized membrane protein|uniref:Uncharacterized membrane protein n=1 Tax=Lutibacter maritimus TaxID=593133 RepID=A0A1I6QNQ5_9FLAO|nr:DUF2061 domain-containing protein [Lutibacter maritimus]SFS54050.1 Uncharacterized membrane protein [Lutibacter maritimus]
MILDQILTSNEKETEKSFQKVKSSENATRSIVKAISWRMVGTIDTIVISFFITGEIKMALSIGMVEVITKMVLYFFHERVWNLVKWGKK